jgi:hypothetical protein
MLAHSGIILIKKGNKQAGLHFYAGLSPYEFPRSLFNFLNLLKDSKFSESFNNYFDNINVVSVQTAINAIDKSMLTKINESCTWKNLSDVYTSHENMLVDMLFSASFSELPDVSTLIVDLDESDLSHINHIYTIDLDENSVSHHIGGLGYNFERSISYKELIQDLSDDIELNLKNSLSKYSELLKNKYGTID